jgi:hypothetical protein
MRRKYPVARKIMLTMMMMNKDEGGIPYNAGNKDSQSKRFAICKVALSGVICKSKRLFLSMRLRRSSDHGLSVLHIPKSLL